MALFGKKKNNIPLDGDEFGVDSFDSSSDFNSDFSDSNDFAQDPFGGGSDFGDNSSFETEDGAKKTSKGSKGGKAGMILAVVGIVLAIAAAAFLIVTAIIGPRRGECKELIGQFQTSCNKLDLNGIAECLDPRIGNKIKAGLMVLQVATDTSQNELLEEVVELIGNDALNNTLGGETDLVSGFEALEIYPESYGIPWKSRDVRCSVSLVGFEEEMIFTITKRHGKVFIEQIDVY